VRLCVSCLLFALVTALVIPISASAQTDTETPANEEVCDDLMFASPGLYGLCVAFCEAQDCQPDFSSDDPFEQCHPSSPKLLEAYDKRKGEDDPEMPCVQTGCPCWSPEELADLPFPSDGSGLCIHRGDGERGLDGWAIPLEGPSSIVVQTIETGRPRAPILCQYLAPHLDPPVFRDLSISADEYATCTADVIASGRERGFDCWPGP
jgi:hypothetical protein